MKILNNVFESKQIQLFKDYWTRNQHNAYVNWEHNGEILDQRLVLHENKPEYDLIKQIVLQTFTDPVSIWAAYQRQRHAHQIHIDDYGEDTQYFRYTYVFSLDTVPEFKTIVWKEKAHNNKELHKYLETWGNNRTKLSKKSNISELEDLEHTYDENQDDYWCDYLTLDNVYTYQAGCGVLFDATQFHCTSNWLKYPKFTHRELLQVHVLSQDPISI
jgi:hypothetical protein